MIKQTTKDVSTLQIHKLSQELYDNLEANNEVDPYAIYLTPNSFTGIDDATIENIEAAITNKANKVHPHAIPDVEKLEETLDTKADIEIDSVGTVAYISVEDNEDVIDDIELQANVQAAVNNALAQAKASGMFDGADGIKGEDGRDGVSITHSWNDTVLTITSASGTSSVDLKGRDGRDGSNGKDGNDGNDGVSVTHSWDGTFLTITSASGASDPVNLKGEKGDKGDNGDDYVLTDADKSDIAQEAIELLDDTIEEITAIAHGQCKAYVFNTVAELDVALAEYIAYMSDGTPMSETNILNGKTLKTGDAFYIRAEEAPDYWWDEDTNSKQVLEAAKMKLDEYALKSDIPEVPKNLSAFNTDDAHLLVTKTEKEVWNAKSNFSGLYADLPDKPTIPTIPSSLPANGGNADTVNGYQIVVSDTAPSEDNPNIITIVI